MHRQYVHHDIRNIVEVIVFIITLPLQIFIIILNSLNKINHRNKHNE